MITTRHYYPRFDTNKTNKDPVTIDWSGSHLGSLRPNELIEIDQVKIGRTLRFAELNIRGKKINCFIKPIDSLLPVIFDEFKPVFALPKIGCHTFRHSGKLHLAYRPHQLGDSTLDMCPEELMPYIENQVRLTLAFREAFGITDTFEKSIILRYNSLLDVEEIPSVISFLEPGTVCGDMRGYNRVIPERLIDKWFERDIDDTRLDNIITRQLFTFNMEEPSATFAYYRPLLEEVVNRIDNSMITYVDLFLDRINNYIY